MSAINLHLQKLTRVSKGDDVRAVARADRIHAIQEIIKALVRGENITSDRNNLRKRVGPGFVSLNFDPERRTAGSSGKESFPFQIISRTDPDTGALQIGVIQDSHLFNSEDRNEYEEPNDDWGLLDSNEENGWLDVGLSDIGKKIWLQIELNEEDQSIDAIDLRYGFPGNGSWDSFPDPIEIDTEDPDNPAQQFYHQIIGEISNPDIDPREGSLVLTIPNGNGTQVQINQLLFNNIFMTTGRTTHDADQPDLPLLVNAAPYGPVTDTGGTGTPIPPEGDISTPWQFGTVEEGNHYDFEMVNASDEDGPKVLIYDGVVYTANNEPFDPDGMPSDNTYTLDVADGNEVWVGFTYENDLNYEITSCWIESGDETPDDDPDANTAYVTIGHVSVDQSDPEEMAVVTPFNEVCGDIEWQPPRFDVRFNFLMQDASEDQTAQVLIYDGSVYSANNEPVDPDGMPSDNSYIIEVQDGYEVWVGFTYDLPGYNILSCWIETGPETPDDDPVLNLAYVTIGRVDVNYAGEDNIAQVYPFNEVCGDIFWNPPTVFTNFDFQLEDASSGDFPAVRVYDGVVIGPNDDPIDPAGMPSDNNTILSVNHGDEIWVGVQWDMETDDGVSGDNIEQAWIDSGPDTPDDEGLVQYITIGHVEVYNYVDPVHGDYVQVFPFNEVCGDIVIQYPPSLDSEEILQLSVDKDTGNVVWKTSKIAQVTIEDADPEDPTTDFLDDIDVLTFDAGDFEMRDGGGGQAIISRADGTSLSVQGDGGDFVDDVDHIQFTIAEDPSAGFINVTDGGDGVAIVEIPALPTTGSGTEVLGSDGGDIQWFPTDTCVD